MLIAKGINVKRRSALRILCLPLILLYSGDVEARVLSGEFRLNNQDVLVTQSQKYQGRFDLRSKLPLGDDFVLTKVYVSFKFQDDQEWVRKAGPKSLKNTGKIIRHSGASRGKKSKDARTDHYYAAKSIIHVSNEQEVAELTIGRTKFFSATMRRREFVTENLGQKSLNLGRYRDAGDDQRVRQHYRITDTVVETQWDGFDGPFEIRRKKLDLATVQDLAHTGMLDFELGGQGDYIFIDARLQYEGFIAGQEATEGPENGFFSTSVWLGLVSLPVGGFLWLQRGRGGMVPRRQRRAPQKRITQRRIPQQRAF